MRTLTRRIAVAASLVLVATLGTTAPAFAGGHGNDHGDHHRGHGHGKVTTLLQADLIGSLTTDQPLFGANPGGVDWTISRSTVTVKDDGRFDAKVRSLLVTATQAIPSPTISASLGVQRGRSSTPSGPSRSTPREMPDQGHLRRPGRCRRPAVLLQPADRTTVPTSRRAGIA